MQKGNNTKYLLRFQINSQLQTDHLISHGFVYVLSLFRSYRYPKDEIEVFSDNRKICKATRYYCTRFHSIEQLTPENEHYLKPFIEASGFQTIQGWFEYMKRDKPNAHPEDLWVIHLIVRDYFGTKN